jgi:hypothetical protein
VLLVAFEVAGQGADQRRRMAATRRPDTSATATRVAAGPSTSIPLATTVSTEPASAVTA